ncbi:hypothetical protein C2E23DRAFT_209681 [Lenzites betulinus]|nr:hypothetical protein C2E23DRAFT_209681 [Lenzites betulinus]
MNAALRVEDGCCLENITPLARRVPWSISPAPSVERGVQGHAWTASIDGVSWSRGERRGRLNPVRTEFLWCRTEQMRARLRALSTSLATHRCWGLHPRHHDPLRRAACRQQREARPSSDQELHEKFPSRCPGPHDTRQAISSDRRRARGWGRAPGRCTAIPWWRRLACTLSETMSPGAEIAVGWGRSTSREAWHGDGKRDGYVLEMQRRRMVRLGGRVSTCNHHHALPLYPHPAHHASTSNTAIRARLACITLYDLLRNDIGVLLNKPQTQPHATELYFGAPRASASRPAHIHTTASRTRNPRDIREK